MFKLKQRIISFILSISLIFTLFLSSVTVCHASSITGWLSVKEAMEIEKTWDWETWIKNVLNTLACAVADSNALKNGSYVDFIKNNSAWQEYIYGVVASNEMLSQIYVEDNKDLETSSVKCSSDFIDWLCKELNNYYHGCTKEHYSDFYDSLTGVYSYGKNNRISWNGNGGTTTTGVSYGTYYESVMTSELTYKYPIFGVTYTTTNELTKEKYYLVDFYCYNPLLADKTIQVNDSFSYIGVKDGISISTYKNGLISFSSYIYNYAYNVFADGHRETQRRSGNYYSSYINYFSPYNYTDNTQLHQGINTNTYWSARNMQFNTQIPIFENYSLMEEAIRNDDLTGALNFSKLSAFASGYSGEDVELSADTLKKIRDILDDTSKDIQDKLDEIGNLIGGQIGDNTEETKKTNSLLESIKEILADILKAVKSIRRWTILDTIIDGADLLTNLLDEAGDIILEIVQEPIEAVASLSVEFEAVGGILSRKFPFCIPWDIAFFFRLFSAEPKTPYYEIPIVLENYGIDEKILIDLSDFEIISKICRAFLSIMFCYELLQLTIKIVNMKEMESRNT